MLRFWRLKHEKSIRRLCMLDHSERSEHGHTTTEPHTNFENKYSGEPSMCAALKIKSLLSTADWRIIILYSPEAWKFHLSYWGQGCACTPAVHCEFCWITEFLEERYSCLAGMEREILGIKGCIFHCRDKERMMYRWKWVGDIPFYFCVLRKFIKKKSPAFENDVQKVELDCLI